MLERRSDARRQAARAREARSRKRRKMGKLILSVEVDEVGLIEALIAAGRLSEPDAGSRPKVGTALQTIVDDFIAWWKATRGVAAMGRLEYKSPSRSEYSEPRL